MAQRSNTAASHADLPEYPVPSDQFARHSRRPRRSPSLMRTFEAAALLPNRQVSYNQHQAPASALFEDCAAAFARGTLISTVMGPMAVEDLMPGDLVETHRGPEPVMWIGSTSYVPGIDRGKSTLTHLLRVTADSLGFGAPSGDLLLGPSARLVIRRDRFRELLNCEAVLAPVADFVDGDRILELHPPSPVQLYHIVLRRHGILRANGLELESYHPGRSAVQEMGPEHRSLMMDMFAHLDDLHDFGDLAFPRTTKQVIDTLRVM